MKKNLLLGILVAMPVLASAQAMTEDQKILYFLGHNVISRSLKQFDFTPEESKYIIQGLTEALNNVPGKVDESYGPKINEFVQKKQAAVAQREKDKGKAYIAKTLKEPKAVKLTNGAIYIPVKEGKGAKPKATDTVKVHYHGTLIDGKVFDSSVERKTPAEFPLNAVIPCWTEGVQKLKVGGKGKLVCPSETAYGEQGMPGAIPGGSTLIFEVELLDIVKAEAKEAKPAAKKEAEAADKAKPAEKK